MLAELDEMEADALAGELECMELASASISMPVAAAAASQPVLNQMEKSDMESLEMLMGGSAPMKM